jgi:hypothetical protein
MWEIDTIQMQEILLKTGEETNWRWRVKGRSQEGEYG